MKISSSSFNFWIANNAPPLFIVFSFPLGLLSSCYFYPFWERLGFEWNLVLVSGLALMAFVLLVPSLRSDVYNIMSDSGLKSLSELLFIVFTLLFVCNISLVSLPGYFSGLICIIMFPFLFVFSRSRGMFSYSSLLLCVCLCIIFVENILLSSSLLMGFGLNDSFVFGDVFPRVFVNTRDGNFFSLVLFSLVFHELFCHKLYPGLGRNAVIISRPGTGLGLLFSIRSNMFLCFCYACVFYNCFITHGRSLMLSIIIGIILVIVRCRSQVSLRRLVSPIGFSCLGAALSYWLFSAVSSSYGNVEVASSLFRGGTGGRFVIWRGWLNSFLDGNWIIGRGFDHFPASYLPEEIMNSMNVHNLYLQILVDMGLVGVVVSLIIVFKSYRWLCTTCLDRDPFCIFVLSAFGVQFFLAAPLQWPAAVWGINILFMLCCDRGLRLRESSSIFLGKTLTIASRSNIGLVVNVPNSFLILMIAVFMIFCAMSIYLVNANFDLALQRFMSL